MIISKTILLGITAVVIIAVTAVIVWQVYPAIETPQTTDPTPTPTPAPTTSPTNSPTATAKPTTSPTKRPTTSWSNSQTTSPTPTPTPEPVVDWNLNFTGGTSINMTNLAFEAYASQHPATWTQNENSTWAGIALYQLVNYYADNGFISYGVLSLGYNITVVGSDGFQIEFNGTRVQGNDNIIVANQGNGTELSGANYPLTLTGSNLTRREGVKNIAQIQINTVLPNMTLTVKGTNGTTIVFNKDDIAALPSISGMAGMSSHGNIVGVGNYTGISIPYLVNLVGGMPNNNTFVRLTSADTYTKDYSYQQVIDGTGYGTYNQTTNVAQETTQPITPILAYAVNNTLIHCDYDVDGNLIIATTTEGPLRSVLINPEGLLTISSLWVKMCVEIDVLQIA